MSNHVDLSNIPKRQLTLFDSVCIIVGIIIGVGIFETTPLIAASVSGPVMLMAVWTTGGLLALVGALCFAELTTAYPQEGGDYVYLTKAFGGRVGFLFVWTQFWIIRPGNIGAMAYVFARYLNQLLPSGGGRSAFLLGACTAIIVLTVINTFGVKSGTWVQNVLTAVKVAGLLTIFAAAFCFMAPVADADHQRSTPVMDWPLAMIMVLFTYGGWNDLSFVAAEVRNPEKNLLRALVLGTLAVISIYILVNLALLRGLGFQGVATSHSVAADLLQRPFGDLGSRAISVLICLSCLGAINGMTLTGARIFYVLGTEHQLFAWLGKWNGSVGAPIRALVGQAAITLVLVIAFGADEEGFERLVVFAAPFFWFFLFLVGVALVFLRHKDPTTRRIYRVVFYPLTPAIFWLTCLFMVYFSTKYASHHGHGGSWWALAIMTVGLAVAFATSPRRGAGC